ncbi:hypothetical protein HX744_27785 [Pseudonocardia sp. ICBG1122]|nr:hypothetical protein [Pseudonocardia pini]
MPSSILVGMSATSFWRKSALLWCLLVSMSSTGTGSMLTYLDEGRGRSLGLSIFAFSLAAIIVVLLVVGWFRHRRERPSDSGR